MPLPDDPLTRDPMEGLISLNPRITFSRYCRSGVLLAGEVCNCWRCRQERNEPVTEESEALAERESEEAKERLRASMLQVSMPRKKPT